MEINLKEFTSTNKNMAMVRATITRKVEELVLMYPKIPVAQLMGYIYRSKGEVQGSPWNWGDERMLKKIEGVHRELADCYSIEKGEFIDDYENTEE